VVAVVPHLAVYGAVGRARRLVKALSDTLPASQHKKVHFILINVYTIIIIIIVKTIIIFA
jgi:hypothetical protein